VHTFFACGHYQYFFSVPARVCFHLCCREVLSLHAEGARKRATARAEQQWQVRESRARRCLPLDHHPGEESLSSDEDTTSNERGSNGNRSGIIGGSTSRSGGNFKSAKDDEESLMLEALNAFDESALGDPQLAEVNKGVLKWSHRWPP